MKFDEPAHPAIVRLDASGLTGRVSSVAGANTAGVLVVPVDHGITQQEVAP